MKCASGSPEKNDGANWLIGCLSSLQQQIAPGSRSLKKSPTIHQDLQTNRVWNPGPSSRLWRTKLTSQDS